MVDFSDNTTDSNIHIICLAIVGEGNIGFIGTMSHSPICDVCYQTSGIPSSIYDWIRRTEGYASLRGAVIQRTATF